MTFRQVVLALVAMAFIGVTGISIYFLVQKRIALAAHGRELRQTVVAEIAPAPVPPALPLAGVEGKDVDGYPLQYVDRPAIRSLLAHGQYADLTRYFEQLESAFEADPAFEYWPSDAGDAFDSAEPSLLPGLDAWAAATPDSFAPYFARGTYLHAVAHVRRGTEWTKDTAPENLAAMSEAAKRAMIDLDVAISKRPRLVAARRRQIQLFALESGPYAAKKIVDDAVAACPTCFQVRVTYLFALTPRWGGSYEEMDAFARRTSSATAPKTRLLAGYADRDRANVLRREKKFEEAIVAIERACSLGDNADFLEERAAVQRARGNLTESLADLNKAVALRPGRPDLMVARSSAYFAAKKFESAGRDLLAALRVDPTDAGGRTLLDPVVAGLVYEAYEHGKAGRREDALRVYDLAAELAPNNREVQQRRAGTIEQPSAGVAANDVTALEANAKSEPDSFRAHQQLDYALARDRKFDEVVAMWTEYLGRHPADGPAYLERGGAYFNLRKLKEAHSDAAKACELGVSEGCARAKQIGG